MTAPIPNEKNTECADAPCKSKCKVGSFVKYTLLLLVVAIGAFCVAAMLQPNDFNYSRSATFKATPAAVFEQVNDFHKWDAWSPWAKVDPNAKTKFEGPDSGKDAKFYWDGNSDVGAGSMTIVESKPDELVRIQLEFVRPMAGVCDVHMTIEPKGNETQLTWSMAGKNGFMGKAMGLIMDCEKMCEDMFDKGLESMRKIVEAKPAETPTTEKPSDT